LKNKKDIQALKQLQEYKEDVSCLPTLDLEEIFPTVQIVKASIAYDTVPATCYGQPTSGIFYFLGGCRKRIGAKKNDPPGSFFLPRLFQGRHGHT